MLSIINDETHLVTESTRKNGTETYQRWGRCQVCETYLTDYLLLPCISHYPLKQNVLERIAPELAAEFVRILHSFSGPDYYFVSRRLHSYEKKIKKAANDDNFPRDVLTRVLGDILIQKLYEDSKRSSDYVKSGLDMIKIRVLESGMIRSEKDCMKWIGYCIVLFWNELRTLHLEHTRQIEATITVPLGLRKL